MLDVSERFQSEIKKSDRNISVRGELCLYDDVNSETKTTYAIPENAIIENSLTITDQLNSGKFGFGSVYIKHLSAKLDYTRIEGFDGKTINWRYAEVRFWFSLNYDDGTSEEICLGYYLVDTKRTSRKGVILTVYGDSYMSKMDSAPYYGISSIAKNDTLYQCVKKNSDYALPILTTEGEFSAFPNANKTYDEALEFTGITTIRDLVMRAAELTGTNVIIRTNAEGETGYKFVQIPTKYTKSGTANMFDLETFQQDNGTVIPANIRYSTDYSDTSVRPTRWAMSFDGRRAEYTYDWNLNDATLEGLITLQQNPFVEDYSAAQSAVKKLGLWGADLRFNPFKTRFLGNPAIECGDYVFLEAGGDVDDTTYYHYGIVTYSKWTYPNMHEIRCAVDESTLNIEDAHKWDGVDSYPPTSQFQKSTNAEIPTLRGKVNNIENNGVDRAKYLQTYSPYGRLSQSRLKTYQITSQASGSKEAGFDIETLSPTATSTQMAHTTIYCQDVGSESSSTGREISAAISVRFPEAETEIWSLSGSNFSPISAKIAFNRVFGSGRANEQYTVKVGGNGLSLTAPSEDLYRYSACMIGAQFNEGVDGSWREFGGGGIVFKAEHDGLVVKAIGSAPSRQENGIPANAQLLIPWGSGYETETANIMANPTSKLTAVAPEEKAKISYSDDGIHIEYKGHTKFIPWD